MKSPTGRRRVSHWPWAYMNKPQPLMGVIEKKPGKEPKLVSIDYASIEKRIADWHEEIKDENKS